MARKFEEQSALVQDRLRAGAKVAVVVTELKWVRLLRGQLLPTDLPVLESRECQVTFTNGAVLSFIPTTAGKTRGRLFDDAWIMNRWQAAFNSRYGERLKDMIEDLHQLGATVHDLTV